MVNSPFWNQHSKWLRPFYSQIDIGLHLNLTEGKALSDKYVAVYGETLFSLPVLLHRALFRLLNQEVIEAECHAQIDRFVATLGFLPQFIDGHQHTHQFPVIRNAFIRVYQKYLREKRSYVRLVNEKTHRSDIRNNFKKLVIKAMGARALKQLLEEYQIPHNRSFAGIYSFAKPEDYRKLFKLFLENICDGGLIMCHPGLISERGDRIARARHEEYQYFVSEQFLIDCSYHDTELTYFAQK